jgi:hypothetical protein
MTVMKTMILNCGLFVAAANRGFSTSPEVSKLWPDRQVEIGFDVYCGQSEVTP